MRIKEVKYKGDHKLIIEFEEERIVEADFHDFIFNTRNPMTSQFKDKKLFSRVQVWHGILDWFGEMDFDPSDIYYDRIPGVKIHEIYTA